MVRSLLAHGQAVRALVRSPVRSPGAGALPPEVEVVQGDAARLPDLVAAAEGCESIIHGLNLPYAEWDPGMVALTHHVVEASGLTGAAVVFPGNIDGLKPIYAVPLPVDAPIRDTNDRPNRKGVVRNQMEDHLSLNSETRNIRTIVVRSGDFYGPGVDNGRVGPMFRAALAGTAVPWFVSAANGHSFTPVEDVARVATELLLRTDRPRHEVVNVAGEVYTDAAAWAAALALAAGRPSLPVKVYPAWQVRLSGLWSVEAREFGEILYQWDAPILLDDARTRRILPEWRPRPAAEALAETLAWFRG